VSPEQRALQQGLGLELQALTPALAQQLQLRDTNVRGLVVGTVDPNSDAGQKGVQSGDIILSINNAPTATPAAAQAAIEAARRAGRTTVLLQLRRGNAPPAYLGVELARR
jgi:serine protease Do